MEIEGKLLLRHHKNSNEELYFYKGRMALPLNLLPMYSNCSWSGDKALKELQEANISQQCFPILRECAVKVHMYNDNSVVLENITAAVLMYKILSLRQLKLLQTLSQG